jgi:hexosaminidase
MLTGMGKKLIGWDEILQGGLAPEASVMSWRGFEGGIEAARRGHDVIMCPTNYCYFDYYQADPEFEPEAIGGLITLRKVYSFRPVPSELNADESRHILGGQGNLWTEYIPSPEKAEYMAIPRMTALAEVLWSPEENLDWDDFRSRLLFQYKRFDQLGVKYSHGSGKVSLLTDFDPSDKVFSIRLETEAPGTEIHYTIDGSDPDELSSVYKEPVVINESCTLKAIAYKDGKRLEKPAVYSINRHAAVGAVMKYNESYSERYPAQGAHALNDGLQGSPRFNDGMWQGFNGNNLDVVIELPDIVELHSVSLSCLQDQRAWIFLPEEVRFYTSDDGNVFQLIGANHNTIPQTTDSPVVQKFECRPVNLLKSKYIRVEGINIGKCPSWHEGAGEKAWIFADEIIIN